MTEPGGGWSLPTPADFGFLPTVYSHGAYRYPPFHWNADAETLTRILRDGTGRARAVTLREEVVKRVEVPGGAGGGAPEEVRTTALSVRTPGWEPDEDGMAAVDETVVYTLELARDLHEFHELCRDDPGLRRLADLGAGRLLRCPTLWEELAKAICIGEAGWSDAPEAVAALAGLGPAAEGAERLHAWPRPARVLEAGPAELRAATGLDDAPDRVVELARRVEEGSLEVEAAEAGLLDGPELRRLFRSVAGVEDAAADRLLVLYGITDRIPLDPASVAFIRDRHFGGRTPTRTEIEERYGRYGRWKGLAFWFEVVQATLWPEVGLSR